MANRSNQIFRRAPKYGPGSCASARYVAHSKNTREVRPARPRRLHAGFVSFDFLFALLAVLLITSYTVIFSSFLEARSSAQLERQILFDKLVSASDYAVKIGAAKTEGTGFPEKKTSPNLITGGDFTPLENELGKTLHMSLSIGFAEDGFEGKGTCIYRLVVFAPTGDIRKLYFCGDG